MTKNQVSSWSSLHQGKEKLNQAFPLKVEGKFINNCRNSLDLNINSSTLFERKQIMNFQSK